MADLNLSSVYGGMNNVIQSDKLNNEQCTLLENVEYVEQEKKLKGSKKVIPTGSKSNKLFEVIYSGKKYLVSIRDDGLYFYSDFANNEKEDIKISTPLKPLNDIIYNEDGLIYSFGNEVFLYTNYGLSEKLNNLSVYFNAELLLTDPYAAYIQYYNNTIYTIPYSHIAGYAVKCFKLTDKQIEGVDIVSSPTFTKMNGSLFCLSNNKLGLIAGSNHLDSSYAEGYELAGTKIIYHALFALLGYDASNNRSSYSAFSNNIKNNFQMMHYANVPSIIPVPTNKRNVAAFLHEFKDTLLVNGEYKIFNIAACCFYSAVNDPNDLTVSTYNCEIRIKVIEDGSTFYKQLFFTNSFKQTSLFSNAPYLTFLYKIFYFDRKIYIFNCVEELFIINLDIDLKILDIKYERFVINFNNNAGDNFIKDVTQNNNTFYILKNDKKSPPESIIYKLSVGNLFSNISFLSMQNSRLILGQNSSLYYSGVGDFKNWDIETDGDALYLEVGYKDGSSIVAGKVFGDNIIIIKDNGYIYKVAGSYPNWVVSKIAETSELTSNIFDYQGVLIFGTVTGLKKINPPNYYGEMLIEDFQNSIVANNVRNISLSEKRKTLIFCSEDYVFEYIINLNIFVVYQAGIYKQYLEYYNENIKDYEEYFLSTGGNICKLSKTELNTVTVKRNLIHHQNSIVIKSITLFTDVLESDTEITIYLFDNINFKRVLKQGQSKHKIFITKRLRELQLKYIHAGSIFIYNIIIEYSNVLGV